ncbi:MAG: DUF4162 domain-containing protein [Actinobacteria bacterium]|nr:DUF4162 domain-containing protein [Actinomycetota bacterium]
MSKGKVVLQGEVARIRQRSESRVAVIGFADDTRWEVGDIDAEIVRREPRWVHLRVSRTVDPASVLASAERAGRVMEFSFSPPDLSEVFLESIGESAAVEDEAVA